MKIGKIVLYGAAGLAVVALGVALFKKWSGRVPGAPAVTYSGGLDKSGAPGAGVEYS